jgi:hypothetical protein
LPYLLGGFRSAFLARCQWYLQFTDEAIGLEVECDTTIELLFSGLLNEP